jgi:LuxR family maltose regulon positive regulatory protein
VYPRERLFARLDECLEGPAVWVSGIPGAGKTTLIASYLAARKLQALWYRADSGDTDPAAVGHYLQIAASRLAGQAGSALPVLASRQTDGLGQFPRSFFAALYASLGVSCLLVVDNTQEALSSASFRSLLVSAISEAPNHIRLVIVSRTRPPGDFARLLANGDLVALAAEELLFTEDESIAVQQLASPGSRARASVQMRKLHQVTGGWAAGLKLLLHLESADLRALVNGQVASDTALLDYLSSEVFDRQSEAIRAFLLKVAHLPHMTPTTAADLGATADAARILEGMHSDNLFVSMHDAGGNMHYEFHPLLRRFLLLRARSDLSGDERDRITRHAAALLAEAGDLDAAAQVLRSGCHWPDLQRLVIDHAAYLLDRGWHRTLSSWLDALPEERVTSDPWLCYWQGAALVPQNTNAARECLRRAYALFREHQIGDGSFLAWSAVVDLICLEWADFSQLDHWLDEAETLHDIFGAPAEETAQRFAASMFSALFFRRPQDPAIHQCAERLLSLIENCADRNQRILLGCNLQIHYTVGVGLKVELDRLMKAIDPLAETALTPLAETLLCALKCMHYWSRGRSVEAAAAADRGSQMARANDLRIWDFLLGALQVYAWLNSGELGRGRAALAQLESCLDPRRKVDVAHYHYLASFASLLSDDAAQALTQIETANAISNQYGGPQQDALGSFTKAQALHAMGRTGEAWPVLENGRKIGLAMDSDFLCFQADLCEALFALDGGDDERCARALERAFAAGAARDYLNHNSFRPAVMARLCAFALGHGIFPEYARRLIRRRCLKPPCLEVECWPWPVRIFTLGRFSIVVDGQPVAEAGRLAQKPVELLQALIAHGGRQIAISLLIETLWPDAESKGGRGAFETTLSRLRRLLGHEDSLLLERGRLTLNPSKCWVDIWLFNRLLNQMQATFQEDGQPDVDALQVRTQRLLRIYQGDFLGREECRPWALPIRERLRSRLGSMLADVGRQLEAGEHWDEAVRLYQRTIELEPLAESSYRRLMACLERQGEVATALHVYLRCSEALQTGLGAVPSRDTEAIRDSLQRT